MITIKLTTGTFEYDPTSPLGRRGGFGQVFAGKTANGDVVAIKKLHLSSADAAHRELRIAEVLSHDQFEHVIRFMDAGEDADTGNYFVVMPKAEESLQNAIEREAPFDAAKCASTLLQITKGLIEVGQLVHRDLKPDNVLFHDGKWKVADLGIARFIEEATSSNTLKDCLSPLYAAPEQWRFERATHATDIYALGCIGYCLLTGFPPFRNNPGEEHQKAPVSSFACQDPRLSTLIKMMLRKLPQTRPVLSRVRQVLEEILARPQKGNTSDSMVVLASVAATVADKEQSQQAQKQATATARFERVAVAKAAFEILTENVERLWGKIHAQAPNARRDQRTGGAAFGCHLGQASLVIVFNNTNYVEAGTFTRSGWDVISHSSISVAQHEPSYEWSASLWYMRFNSEDYRWHEVSYWRLGATRLVPFACSDFKDADGAAAPGVYQVRFAFGPVAIDDELEEEFHQRWIWLFAKAAAGELRQPSFMPIRTWPPRF